MKASCFFLAVFSFALQGFSGELFVSSQFGFAAKFPEKVETIETEHVSGPASRFITFHEESELIYFIDAHHIVALDAFAVMNDEASKDFVQLEFKSYLESIEASDIKEDWESRFAWPTLHYELTQTGIFEKGVVSKKDAYKFTKNRISFTVGVYSFDVNRDTSKERMKFMSSFVLMKPEDIESYRKGGGVVN